MAAPVQCVSAGLSSLLPNYTQESNWYIFEEFPRIIRKHVEIRMLLTEEITCFKEQKGIRVMVTDLRMKTLTYRHSSLNHIGSPGVWHSQRTKR